MKMRIHPVCFLLVAICVVLCSSVSAKESTDNLEQKNQRAGGVFVPEKDWKVIKEGQSIPAGLHVRMDLTTGLREAKLMDNSQSDPQQPSEIQLVPSARVEDDEHIQQRHELLRSEMEKALKNMVDSSHADFKSGEEDNSYNATEVRAKYRSYAELKKDFAALNGEIKTDQETIKELMARYRNCRNDEMKEIKQINQERLTILQDLEYYVHQVDNALDFFTMNGSDILRHALEDESVDIRSEAASILGAATQNNRRVKLKIMEKADLLSVVLKSYRAAIERFPTDATEENFIRRVLFAVSSVMRNFRDAQSWMMHGTSFAGSLHQCMTNRTLPLRVRQKAVTLLNDLMEEWLAEDKPPTINGMWLGEWCRLLASDLNETEHGYSKEILHNIELCTKYYPSFHENLPDLSSFISLYERLAVENNETDPEDFYSSLARTAEKLQSSRKPRDITDEL